MSETKYNTVDYKSLKREIIKGLRYNQNSVIFDVDYPVINENVSELGLQMIPMFEPATIIEPKDIPFLSEYFVGNALSWIDRYKAFTTLTFIQTDYIDNEARELLYQVMTPPTEDPNFDFTAAMSKLVANYPCYFATIVSYMSNDPSRMNRPTYEIACRGNKVVIRSSAYKYNPKDMA